MRLENKKKGEIIHIGKRAQLTLFIILAIIIVSAIVFLFIYFKPKWDFSRADIPKLDSCFSKSIDEHVKNLAINAGLKSPEFKHMYMGKNYTFLCYTDEYHQPCVNQVPLITRAFEDSLKELLSDEFQKCYDSSIDDLKKRGYEVKSGKISFDLEIFPNDILINVDAPLSVSSGETSTKAKPIRYKHKTNLYELLSIVSSIVQQETYYGDSEQMDFMRYYPKIKIVKQRIDDGVKVYNVIETKEGIDYQFAIKSRPWPAGGIY